MADRGSGETVIASGHARPYDELLVSVARCGSAQMTRQARDALRTVLGRCWCLSADSGVTWRDTQQAMSHENAEMLRRGYAAWLEGGVEAIIPFLDPEVEWSQDPSFPGAKIYKGHDGVRRWDAWLGETFEERRVEIERLVVSNDRVLVLLRLYIRGRESGLELENDLAHLWTFPNGKRVRVQFFLDSGRAFDAAGLRE